MVLGRKSIFLINSIIFLSCFGLMMIYFIVFGNISASIVADIFTSPPDFFLAKPLYILIISVCILPLILKKEIKELKIASILLFLAIGLFFVTLIL